jgi:hypothetical protein
MVRKVVIDLSDLVSRVEGIHQQNGTQLMLYLLPQSGSQNPAFWSEGLNLAQGRLTANGLAAC